MELTATTINQLPKSVVREIRMPRSVGAGGGRPPPATRWAESNLRPYRELVLLPRQPAKLARGTKDKEHAMSQTPNTAIAVIGIDIGKNSFHLVGHDARRHRAAAKVVAWPSGSESRQYTALPDRHGSLRRRTSPEPQTRIAWSRAPPSCCSAAIGFAPELCPLRDTKMPPISAAPVAMTTFSQLNLRQV